MWSVRLKVKVPDGRDPSGRLLYYPGGSIRPGTLDPFSAQELFFGLDSPRR